MSLSLSIVGSRDPKLADMVRASGSVSSVSSVTEVGALVDRTSAPADVLLVDLRSAREIPPQLAVLRRQYPATNVILLLSTLDPAMMLQAMRAGISECIADPVTGADIASAIGRLVGARPAAMAGPVFAFVGAKGGVGTTTTAVNVATELAKLSSGRTLLADLHLAYGDAAVFLAANARFSLLDAIENIQRLDAQFLKSLVAKTASGLDLLASSDRPTARPADVRRLGSIIEFAASHYSYTVLDVPRCDLTVLDCLDAASKVFVIANQELATVRNAGRMAAALKARYPKAMVSTIINRVDRRAEIGHGDIEKMVGGVIAHQFPSDYRRALTAMHKGRPLALDNHNDLSASFSALARELAGMVPKPSATNGKGFKAFLGL